MLITALWPWRVPSTRAPACSTWWWLPAARCRDHGGNHVHALQRATGMEQEGNGEGEARALKDRQRLWHTPQLVGQQRSRTPPASPVHWFMCTTLNKSQRSSWALVQTHSPHTHILNTHRGTHYDIIWCYSSYTYTSHTVNPHYLWILYLRACLLTKIYL